MSKTIEEVVDHAMKDAVDTSVVFTPLVWRPDPADKGSRQWYFTISTAGREGWRADMIIAGNDRLEANDIRLQVVMAFAIPPIVAHDCDDELYAARLCEQLWPGDNVTAARKKLEVERAIGEAFR